MPFLVKTLVSALLIAAISEIAKRFTWFAAILASLPITSILAMIWLYYDTKDATKVADLSYGVFWMVAPSLVFFLLLPILLKHLPFAIAMLLGCAAMAGVYFAYAALLPKLGVKI
ncbi:MAG: DUF3147 family protein [Deltaproteobacteria bacterium]|nr:DUF3147 family protein [Deltaproteobacteria bacterium]